MPGKPKVEENKVIVGDINTAELYVKASRVKLDEDSLKFNLQIASPSPPGYDVTSEERIERDGFPARRVSAVGTKEQSDYAVESLGVYANGILYSAVIFGKKDIVPKMSDRFFDSFKIEKE